MWNNISEEDRLVVFHKYGAEKCRAAAQKVMGISVRSLKEVTKWHEFIAEYGAPMVRFLRTPRHPRLS
jgi:hypothetical protein